MNQIPTAITHLRAGRVVLLIDDATEVARAYAVCGASTITEEVVAFLARECRGIITAPTAEERLTELQLPLMVERPAAEAPQFSVSVEARTGVSTGISAADRATTLRALATGDRRALVTPGHIFPLHAKAGGSLVRTSPAEGAVDLVTLAGLPKVAALTSLLSESGEHLTQSEAESFAVRHGLHTIRLSEIVVHRLAHEKLVERVSEAALPTKFAGSFQAVCFRSLIDGAEHLALIKGELDPTSPLLAPLLVRVQAEQLIGDLLGKGEFAVPRLNSNDGAKRALKAIEAAGQGVFVYIRHPRRGLLAAQVKALSEGKVYGTEMRQLREFGTGAQILKALGIARIKLLTNSPPQALRGIESFQLEIAERAPF